MHDIIHHMGIAGFICNDVQEAIRRHFSAGIMDVIPNQNIFPVGKLDKTTLRQGNFFKI